METADHEFEDVRLAFVAAISFDGDDGFEVEDWWNACRDDRATACHHWLFDGERWRQPADGDGPKADHTAGDDPANGEAQRAERIRSEYEIVEELFLNKALTVDRERFELRRTVHAMDHQVDFDHVAHEPLTPDVVVTHFEPYDVATLTVNFNLESVSTDDLVYLKSLKWDSTTRFEGSPGVTVHRNGELRSADLEPQGSESAYLNTWLEDLFDQTIGVEDATLNHGDVLDCIEIRGG